MKKNVHEDFLRLLGWEGEELDNFMPQWLSAAAFLQLSEDDVDYALNKWIPDYWDVSLLSVRKLIAAVIREVVELAKIRQFKEQGHKIIYSNPTASHACIYANKIAGGDRMHVFYPDFLITTVNQAFFGKMTSGVDSSSCMSGSCSHCALNAIRLGSCIDGQLLPPTVTWSWGLHCNEAPKTEEMINCLHGDDWLDIQLTIPHDAPLGTLEADDEYRVDYLAKQIEQSQNKISEITGIEVTEDHLRQATEKYLDYMHRIDVLTDLVVNADPLPISGSELNQFCICMQVCFDTGLDYINEAIDIAIEELAQRIEEGRGVVPKGAPKLACHFQPLHLPWIDRAFMENGVCIALGRIFPRGSWLEDAVDKDDMYRTSARHCFLCPNAVNMENEAAISIKILNQYNFDGALFGFFSHDRWIGALHKTMVQKVEETTGIPHFYLEGDFWGSDGSSEDDRLPVIRSICNSLKISKL